jgi:hypothetical protein
VPAARPVTRQEAACLDGGTRMKKLIILVLLVATGWYGWKHRDLILTRHPSHDAVIVNHSGREMDRIRLTVGGQTMVQETLADDRTATFPFRVTDDSEFDLVWQWANKDVDQRWHGGRVPKGPMVQRHIFTIDGEGAVLYEAQNKLGS